MVAQRYCIECKAIYSELSKIIQNVLASRRELVRYDTHKGEEEEREGVDRGHEDTPQHLPSPHTPSPAPSPVATPALLKVRRELEGVQNLYFGGD